MLIIALTAGTTFHCGTSVIEDRKILDMDFYNKIIKATSAFVCWTVTSFLCHQLAKLFLNTATTDTSINTGFVRAVLITLVQMTMCYILTEVQTSDARSARAQTIFRVKVSSHVLATMATNYSMTLVHASSTFAVKLLEPVTSALVQYLVLGSPVSPTALLSLPIVISGSLVFCLDSVTTSLSVMGVVMAALSNILLAFRNVAIKLEQVEGCVKSTQLRQRQRVVTTGTLLVLMVVVLEFLTLHNLLSSSLAFMTLTATASGVFHVIYSYISTNVVLLYMTVVSHSVANIFKRVLVVLLLYIVGQREATAANFTGLVVCTAGLVAYVSAHKRQTVSSSGTIPELTHMPLKGARLTGLILLCCCGLTISPFYLGRLPNTRQYARLSVEHRAPKSEVFAGRPGTSGEGSLGQSDNQGKISAVRTRATDQDFEGYSRIFVNISDAIRKKYVRQSGSTNQVSEGRSGTNDKFSMRQFGANDKLSMRQFGANDKLSMRQSGINSKISMVQSGANDKISMKLSGVKSKMSDTISSATVGQSGVSSNISLREPVFTGNVSVRQLPNQAHGPRLTMMRNNLTSTHQSFLHKRLITSPTETDTLSPTLNSTFGVIKEAQRIHINLFSDIFAHYKYAMLFDVATFENKGDPAITAGEVHLLRRLGIQLVYYCNFYACVDKNLRYAKKLSLKYSVNDLIILLQGGGNVVGYEFNDHLRAKIFKLFPNFKIVLFPQSIYLKDNINHIKFCQRLYRNRQNFTMILRDRLSLQHAQKYFSGKGTIMMAPDMAFQIGSIPRFISPSFDILWLKRSDGESPGYKVPKSPRGVSMHSADWWSWKTPKGETSMETSFLMANNGLVFVQRGRVVITDRLHGHILCTLLDIPHVLIDNKNRKLSAYHNTWTRGVTNTVLANNATHALQLALELLKKYNNVLPTIIPFMDVREKTAAKA